MINNHHNGQTLIETLMGLFVVTIGVVSSVTLFVASTKASGDTEDQIVAANLAREGIEAVRGIRDDNWLALEASPGSFPWDQGLAESGSDITAVPVLNESTRKWELDFKANNFNDSCGTFVCADIYKKSSGLHVQFLDGATPFGEKTRFKRLIALSDICKFGTDAITIDTNDCPSGQGVGNFNKRKIGIQVVSQVQWQDGEQTKIYKLEEQIYQWKEISL